MSNTEKIRHRAFELWEAAGRPEGRDLEHWLKAEAEFANLAPAPAPAAPRKAAAKDKPAVAKPAAAGATAKKAGKSAATAEATAKKPGKSAAAADPAAKRAATPRKPRAAAKPAKSAETAK